MVRLTETSSERLSVLSDDFEPGFFRQILAESTDGVVVTHAAPIDGDGPEIVYVNPAFTRLTGYAENEALGATPAILNGPDTDTAALQDIREALSRDMPVHGTVLQYARGGRPFWCDLNMFPLRDSSGLVTHFAAFLRDRTREMEAAQELYDAATTDELTGFYNRRHFTDSLEQAIRRCRRYGHALSLLTFDLDRFKAVNDTYGHPVGDEVLRTVAATCKPMVRDPDALGRIGGEEFAVLLNETPLDGARIAAERLRTAIEAATTEADGAAIKITASFGCAQLAAGEDARGLIARADDALYRAKQNGRNRTETAA